MYPKNRKSEKADLENRRLVFFFSGLTLALTFVMIAIEWNFKLPETAIIEDNRFAYAEEVDWTVPITVPTKPEAPVQKKAEVRINPDEFLVVPNETALPSLATTMFSTPINDIIVEIIDPDPVDNEIFDFTSVESRPVFKGCESIVLEKERFVCFQSELLRYVSKNFKVDEQMQRFSTGEKVFVEFIIEKDGSVQQARVIRGEDDLIGKESVRILKSLPQFTPAKLNGKPVRMSYILPINVKLQ